jgi:hypothetical protein
MYDFITLGEMRAELLNRLQDSGAVSTPIPEANLYLVEGLRILNALTLQPGTVDFAFNFNQGDTWKSLNFPGSPRQRTVTDTDLYSQIEAMLMEPMSGGVWSGTNQFNIAMISGALQYRRDELLLESTANVVNLLQPSPLLSMRSYLPDSTLNLHRVRWIQADSSFMPYALGREDIISRNANGVNLSIQPGEPDSWMITADSPLTFDVSCPPNQPGTWDMLVSFSGQTLNPPASTPVGIPDDWTPALIYGTLADVLANSPEGRDAARAKYCLQRYEQFKKAMTKMPWLLQAQVAQVSVDTPGFKEQDTQLQNWEQRQYPDDPVLVVGGVDLVALGPFVVDSGATVGTILTVVGNAPVPVADTDPIQLSRDGVDAVLAYAQHVASFKMGGSDFAVTFPLLEQFEAYCREKNAQYDALGIFRPDMILEGQRQEIDDPRFQGENEKVKRGTSRG